MTEWSSPHHNLTFSNFEGDAGQLLKILGWKILAADEIHRAIMVFKSLRGFVPGYLASKFSQRNTSYNLKTPRTNLMFDYHGQIFQKRSSYIGITFLARQGAGSLGSSKRGTS